MIHIRYNFDKSALYHHVKHCVIHSMRCQKVTDSNDILGKTDIVTCFLVVVDSRVSRQTKLEIELFSNNYITIDAF